MLQLLISFNCTIIPENMFSERVVVALKIVEINCFHATHVIADLLIDSFYSRLDKYCRL